MQHTVDQVPRHFSLPGGMKRFRLPDRLVDANEDLTMKDGWGAGAIVAMVIEGYDVG
jgi:hypothetical protein